jgi:hypothetical protein
MQQELMDWRSYEEPSWVPVHRFFVSTCLSLVHCVDVRVKEKLDAQKNKTGRLAVKFIEGWAGIRNCARRLPFIEPFTQQQNRKTQVTRGETIP